MFSEIALQIQLRGFHLFQSLKAIQRGIELNQRLQLEMKSREEKNQEKTNNKSSPNLNLSETSENHAKDEQRLNPREKRTKEMTNISKETQK